MFKIKKSVVVISAVVLVSVFVYYRYATKIFQTNRGEENIAVVGSKEVSAVASYGVPEDRTDTLRFVLAIDKQGVIESVKTLDAATNEVPEKKKEFNDQLTVIIKGKKLSELTAIDKVGKSSLTTQAFNSVIDQLKAQL